MYQKIFILFFVLTATPCFAESKLKNELVEQVESHEPVEFDSITLCPYSSTQLKRIRDCVGSNPEAARRAQEILLIATGHLNRKPQPIKKIHYEGLVNTEANRIYSCERIYEDNKVVTYRFILLDTDKNFRPYKCGFSYDGVLLWIGLDQGYEFLLLENAAGFIRSQSDMRDSEPMYWSR